MTGPNYVYGRLVSEPKDFVGAVAYSLYKQKKVEWILQTKAANGGIEPTPAELEIFHTTQLLPTSLQGYRDHAQTLTNGFLMLALQKKVEELTVETIASALALKLELAHQRTVMEVVALRIATDALRDEVLAKKGFFGWFADFGASFLVNIATIVFIGLLALGASKTEWFNQHVENAVKPGTPRTPPNPAPPTSP